MPEVRLCCTFREIVIFLIHWQENVSNCCHVVALLCLILELVKHLIGNWLLETPIKTPEGLMKFMAGCLPKKLDDFRFRRKEAGLLSVISQTLKIQHAEQFEGISSNRF